jgi:hypothetical protein
LVAAESPAGGLSPNQYLAVLLAASLSSAASRLLLVGLSLLGL